LLNIRSLFGFGLFLLLDGGNVNNLLHFDAHRRSELTRFV